MTISKSAKAGFLPGFRMITTVACALFCIAAPAIAASSKASEQPAGTRAMTPFEIYALYKNKSWQWDNGAGHMTDAGRQFTAWADGEKGKSWAEGRWVITETGGLCLNATWHSGQGAFPAKTCFSHRIGNGTIYQKREPDGEWYIFRHAKAREDDEAHKLVFTDLVSQQSDSIKTALGAAQLPEQ
ncbi:DUF995 domain-containing protein (plasmid) [Phyllobacterium sp. A18/5-2]|uniref:DUF995 domain-containing protein n=1 Tax=Phyllobacterium sp. A18/5-2 TaxID=2978392 RepID=UPI0021C6A0A6|nr:DUF995 domain-containing protein [Phyllobacterium sp. A18/5-2]UXN66729.1 DUF995 domain-containing protein [Phyllobacterium sp. A18/5-2]